jgi:putative hemolysin
MLPIICLLILASGFFSLFEQALQAVRTPRLKKEAADAANRGAGSGRAKRYLRVLQAAENPGDYYAASRIWSCALRTVTVVLAVLSADGSPLHVALCTVALASAFLLFGDLVPGIIARSEPERIAAGTFPLFWFFAQPLRPVFFLAQAASGKLRLALYSKPGRTGMTEDELRRALIEGEESGIVESKERTMVEGVFYLGDRPLSVFMTHRSEIQWLDIHAPAEDIRAKVLEYRTQRCFPVADGTLDAIIGAAYLEDIILDLAGKTPAGLRAVMKKAALVPETMPALKAFESFRRGEADFLFVIDEYGGFAGMVSVRALVEEIVGELAAPVREEEQAVKQEDGSWIAGGTLSIDDAAALLSLPDLAAGGDYHTLAGFVLSLAGELPGAGDSFAYQGYRFTVLDMDGNRIGRIGIKDESNK